jgi:histidyl-tRNA synthetase
MLATLAVARALREAGLPVEVYPDPAKLDKQLKYADSQGIPAALIVGPDEAAAGKVTVKNLSARTQTTVPLGEAAAAIRQILEGPLGT